MIRITRGACPQILSDHKDSAGDYYNKPTVVEALWKMQGGKCCYCERRVPDNGHDKAVEHYRPKSIFKKLKNDWENLLLVCAQCNGKKRNRFPMIVVGEDGKERRSDDPMAKGRAGVMDPCETDPEQHLDFDFTSRDPIPVIMARKNTWEGRLTIEVVGLDQAYYARHHSDHYQLLMSEYRHLLRAKMDNDQITLDEYARKMEGRMAADAPLAGLARSFVRFKGLDQKLGLAIPGN